LSRTKKKPKQVSKSTLLAFDEGATIFNDPLLVTIPDPTHSNTEQRYVSSGISIKGRLLAIVHTERNDKIRLISCRKATPRERETYDKLNK